MDRALKPFKDDIKSIKAEIKEMKKDLRKISRQQLLWYSSELPFPALVSHQVIRELSNDNQNQVASLLFPADRVHGLQRLTAGERTERKLVVLRQRTSQTFQMTSFEATYEPRWQLCCGDRVTVH